MAITKKIHVFKDSNDRYRRIHWDSFYVDDVFVGLSPVPTFQSFPIEIASTGTVTVNDDFLDKADQFEIADVILETDEETFLDGYDDVCYSYESDDAQTYETGYDKTARQS